MTGPWLRASEGAAFVASYYVNVGDILEVKVVDDSGEHQGSALMVVQTTLAGFFDK